MIVRPIRSHVNAESAKASVVTPATMSSQVAVEVTKKRRKLVHRRLVLLTSQRLALSIESNTPEFELIKAALAAKHGIRRIARELQTGVGTVLRIKSELAAA